MVVRRPSQVIKPLSTWWWANEVRVGLSVTRLTWSLYDYVTRRDLRVARLTFPRGDRGGPELAEQLSPGPCNSPKVSNAFTDFVKRKASPLPTPFNVRLIRRPGNFAQESAFRFTFRPGWNIVARYLNESSNSIREESIISRVHWNFWSISIKISTFQFFNRIVSRIFEYSKPSKFENSYIPSFRNI